MSYTQNKKFYAEGCSHASFSEQLYFFEYSYLFSAPFLFLILF